MNERMNEWSRGMKECIMNCEKTRFDTFHSWPTNAEVDPQRIAKAGFYYTGVGLEVECFSCGGRITEWNYGDQVMMRHRQMNPDCPFVKDPIGSGNVPVVNRSPSLYSQTSESGQSAPLNGTGQNSGNFLAVSQDCDSSTSSTSCASSSIVNTSDNSSNVHIENVGGASDVPARNYGNTFLLYKSEAARLHTFDAWPKRHIVSPQQLAKTGFFYLQDNDRVQCAFCRGIVQDWEAGDVPAMEHRLHFPNCAMNFNMPVGNIPIHEVGSGEQRSDISHPAFENVVVREIRPFAAAERETHGSQSQGVLPVNELGIHSHRGPKYPKYSTVESRLRTFNGWPSGVSQTPQQLSQAGFFYTGANDQVRCFHCDGGLRQWDEHDEPWVEHARWFSKCTYVVLVKGEEFIQQSLSDHPPLISTNALQRNEPLSPQGVIESSSVVPSFRIREVSEEEIEGLMNSAPVRTALEMGLDAVNIKRVLRRNMEQTGLPYSSIDALIESVLDISSDTNTPETSTTGSGQQTESQSDEASQSHSRAVSSSLSASKSLPNFAEEAGGIKVTIQKNNNSAQSMPQLCRVKVAGSQKLESGKEHSLEEENRRLKEARLCKICMDEEVGVVFVPCGHLVTCVNCTPSIEDCPMCRQPIKATVRTFLS